MNSLVLTLWQQQLTVTTLRWYFQLPRLCSSSPCGHLGSLLLYSLDDLCLSSFRHCLNSIHSLLSSKNQLSNIVRFFIGVFSCCLQSNHRLSRYISKTSMVNMYLFGLDFLPSNMLCFHLKRQHSSHILLKASRILALVRLSLVYCSVLLFNYQICQGRVFPSLQNLLILNAGIVFLVYWWSLSLLSLFLTFQPVLFYCYCLESAQRHRDSPALYLQPAIH